MVDNDFGMPKKRAIPPGGKVVRVICGIFKVATVLTWVVAGFLILLALVAR